MKFFNIISLVLLAGIIATSAAHASQSAPPANMVFIPAGEFVMGTNKNDRKQLVKEFRSGKPWYLDEQPKHRRMLSAFYIDRYEVTNAEYRRYLLSTGVTPPDYWTQSGFIFSFDQTALNNAPEDILRKLAVGVLNIDRDMRKMNRDQLLATVQNHYTEYSRLPVANVTWDDSDSFCHWAGKRLPSEAEWEKAARGNIGNEYPWGANWQPGWSNAGEEEWPHGAAPVGSYPKDRSAFGVFDMAGNVSEWTQDWYNNYPGSKYQSTLFGKRYRVARGGGWSGAGHYALEIYYRSAYRLNLSPTERFVDVGFRCVQDINTR